MTGWMNDPTNPAPANPTAPRLRKTGRPKGNRIPVPIRICPVLYEEFKDLAHEQAKQGKTRPKLHEEAIRDLLNKYDKN